MQLKTRVKKISTYTIIGILLIATGYFGFIKVKEEVFAEAGNTSPNFTLKDLAGKEHSLTDYRGKGVIINFWATYCPPCEEEMPYLEKAYRQYNNEGIEILAINASEPTRMVKQFMKRHELSFPILLDLNGNVIEQYQVITLPLTFFIDSKGKIVEKFIGELTEEKIEEGIALIKP